MKLSDAVYYPWNTHSVTWDGDSLVITGWALPPRGTTGQPAILCNGLKSSSIDWSDSPTVRDAFPKWPGNDRAGFSARWDNIGSPDFLVIEVKGADGNPLAKKHSFVFPTKGKDFIVTPPADVMEGIGSLDTHGFIQTGATLAFHFNRVLREATGNGFDKFDAVLDWGCGSGRVIQHLKHDYVRADAFLAGLDVDPTAILWCGKTVAGIDFGNCELSPPTKFANNSFDVVYAYSVLTHLRADDAAKWVAEVRRILKPGGYFLFTTLGNDALRWLHPNGNAEIESSLAKTGIWDLAKNTNIDRVIEDQEYYRNTWVTDDYVKKQWGSALNYLHTEKCFHFYQDIWVFQK